MSDNLSPVPSLMPTDGFLGKLGELIESGWFYIYVSVFFIFFFYLRNYFKGGKAFLARDFSLKGKRAVVTGANTGIGYQISLELARRGAVVIMACRDPKKGGEAAGKVRYLSKGTALFWKLDLNDFESVRTFGAMFIQTYDTLDFLFNNAGVMLGPDLKSKDNFESHFQTNFLGPFLLTELLLSSVQKAKGRIINSSACSYTLGTIDLDDINQASADSFNTNKAYSQSKLAVILWTNWLKDLHCKKIAPDVSVYAVHPGVVDTDIMRHMPISKPIVRFSFWLIIKFMMKAPVDGAQTQIFLACTDPPPPNDETVYYVDCKPKPLEDVGKDAELASKLCAFAYKWVTVDCKDKPPVRESAQPTPTFFATKPAAKETDENEEEGVKDEVSKKEE